MDPRLDRGRRYRLKGNFTRVVVEVYLKLVEHSGATEKIEPDAKAFGYTDWHSHLRVADLNGEVMNEGRNITAVANDNHLAAAALPIYSHIAGLRSIDHTERRSRIHVDPDFVILDHDRDNRHQVVL